MKILGIETSSPTFSLCLNEDDRTLREFSRRREIGGYGDAEIFKEAKNILGSRRNENLGAIAVSIGPGMFTSLRVGLSLAKGIALVNNTPVVAVNTLDVIGVPPSLTDVRITAVVNAYRGEIYAALYESGERVSDYLLLTPDSLLKMLGDKGTILGPGVEVIAQAGLVGAGVELRSSEEYLPTAKRVISLALPRMRNRDFNDIQFLEPYYIKKTDAERNYAKGNAL
ncbi:MAG: tRNA (adenosine(37)-N6)-threonylcarbamoyltransferase complex dimerization subunit type 1 TsaB [candidate division WOR-3 bacterium]|nr:MAG: tRNA (adenosine(37)-N6)-threonylcarbamoyltransferase complex dimerization subunit type 1 TsaB [candidate division WOR-3 bacterium]